MAQGSLFDNGAAAARSNFADIALRKRTVRARTAGQDAYIRALKHNALVFGTGKIPLPQMLRAGFYLNLCPPRSSPLGSPSPCRSSKRDTEPYCARIVYGHAFHGSGNAAKTTVWLAAKA